MLDTSRAHEIREALRSGIMTGKYPIGDRLPPERVLVHDFKVSRDTVRRALQDLEAQYYIQRRGAAGTFVLDWRRQGPENQLNGADDGHDHRPKKKPQLRWLEAEARQLRYRLYRSIPPNGKVLYFEQPILTPADTFEAEHLEVPERSLVMRRFRTIGTVQDVPYEEVTSYYPGKPFVELFESGIDEISLQQWLTENYEPRASRITEQILVRVEGPLTQGSISMLHLGDIWYDIFRTVRDDAGHILQFDTVHVPAEFCRLTYEFDARAYAVPENESSE